MTLIASTRTLDGIVIAGDSLATFLNNPQVKGDVDVQCPSCQHEHIIEATLTGSARAATTLSYAQKIFPFMDNFGVGIYGTLIIDNQSIYSAFREFEKTCRLNKTSFNSAKEAAEAAGNYLHDLLKEAFIHFGGDLNNQPDEFFYSGFQLIGYDNNAPYTYSVTIGKLLEITPDGGLDVFITGDTEVVKAFFGLYNQNDDNRPLVNAFSLQDGIEYVEFLIRTTAFHQRFSRKIPSVGGEIDIALVTLFDGFQWVRQKKLYR